VVPKWPRPHPRRAGVGAGEGKSRASGGEVAQVCACDAHTRYPAARWRDGWRDTPFRAYLCALEEVWLGPLEVINR